jgi:hypothetical protein
MLQASHNHSFVRHGIVALSALAVALRMTSNVMLDPDVDSFVQEQYAFALKQYSKAVLLSRKAILNQKERIRTVLLSCLLVVAFEGLSGHQGLAVTHAQGGVAVLQDWLLKTPRNNKSAASMLSPAPEIVEDELVRALSRLDLQINGTHWHSVGLCCVVFP